MKLVGIAAALAFSAGAAQASTPASTPAAVSAPVQQSAAQKLVNVLMPQEITMLQGETILQASTEHAFQSEVTLSALKDVYPGIEQAYMKAMRPIIRAEIERTHPLYLAELAAFFEQNFTAPELQKLITFWSSAGAQKFLFEANGGGKFDAIAKEVTDQGLGGDEIAVSTGTYKSDLRKNVDAGLSKMSKAQLAEFSRFGLTATGRKFVRLTPEKQQIDLKWANAPMSAEGEARLEAEIPAAIDAYIAAYEAAHGGAEEAASNETL